MGLAGIDAKGHGAAFFAGLSVIATARQELLDIDDEGVFGLFVSHPPNLAVDFAFFFHAIDFLKHFSGPILI